MISEQIIAGLPGAGDIRFDGLKAATPAQLHKNGVNRARYRSSIFLRHARSEIGLEGDSVPRSDSKQ